MNYLIYQLKASILLALLYGIYAITIKNSSQYRYNRVFMVGSLLLAMIIPALKINLSNIQIMNYAQMLPEVVVGNIHTVGASHSFTLEFYINITLFSTLIILCFISFIQIYKLYFLIKSSPNKITKEYTLIETSGAEAFSFFRYIFIGKQVPDKNRNIIIQHELVHINNFHTIDILITEAILLMQWFNPFLWFFRKQLKETHEFEADHNILNQGISLQAYQELLMNQIFKTKSVQFSSFNHNSHIKNRIRMMTKTNQKSGKTRFILAAALTVGIAILFSFSNINYEKNKSIKSNSYPGVSLKGLINYSQFIDFKNPTSKDTIKKGDAINKEYTHIDIPAKFQGKDLIEFNSFVISHIKYPVEAVKKNLQGKAYVQFIVDKDGSITEIKILRGTSYKVLDDEAVRVIKSSPKWTPAMDKGKVVKQAFTIPVEFSLNK
jgi:TonB family protein